MKAPRIASSRTPAAPEAPGTLQRRCVLRALLATASTSVLGGWTSPAAAAWDAALFRARTPEELARLLGGNAPRDSGDLELLADDLVENGSAVRVMARSGRPGTRQMALLVERNPNLLAALFELSPGTQPQITTRIKVLESSRLILLARTAQETLQTSHPLRVTIGGCGHDGEPEEAVSQPPRPTRIRAQVQGGHTEVRMLLGHPMESGQRRNAAGHLVPAHFIRELEVRHEGRRVLAAQWGPAVSRNPYLQFAFEGGQPGERLRVSWLDSRGASRTDEARLV